MRSKKETQIKRKCRECDCSNLNSRGICYECRRGLHVRDKEAEGRWTFDKTIKFIPEFTV